MKALFVGCLSLATTVMIAAPLQGQPAAQPGAASQTQLKLDADEAYRGKDFDRAIELTNRVLEESPDDAVALYLRGSARVEKGIASQDKQLVREGIDDARRAIEADEAENPNYYLPYLYGMSHLSVLEGEENHARTAINVATSVANRSGVSDSSKCNLIYQRGIAHVKLGDLQKGAEDFRQSLEIDPSHLAARMALADALLRSGDLEGAEQAHTAAIEQFPTDPLVYNNRGMFYQSRQRHTDAIADFSKAIELDPNHLQAHLNRGFTFLNSGEYAAAQADFSRAIELNPEYAPAYSLRGTSLLVQNKVRDALEDYVKVIELRPSHAPARADIAFAYFFAQEYDTAAQAFEQAMVLAPESKYLYPWRYAALTLAGRQDSADQAFQAVVERPADERDWFDLLTLFLMGKIEERDLMTSVNAEDTTLRDAQLCEAFYFIGLRMQSEGKGDPARYFRRAVESRATQLSAYRAAQIELSR